MSDYRRLISYIYEYEGKEKGKNVGFVKLEARNGQCRLNLNVKKVYVGGNAVGVYLLGKNGVETFLGNIFIRGGNGEFRATVDAADVEGSGNGLDTYYGLTVHDVKNSWRSYTTIWEDVLAPEAHTAPVPPSNSQLSGDAVRMLPAQEILPGIKEVKPVMAVSNVVKEIEAEIAREEKRRCREESSLTHAAEVGAEMQEMGTPASSPEIPSETSPEMPEIPREAEPEPVPEIPEEAEPEIPPEIPKEAESEPVPEIPKEAEPEPVPEIPREAEPEPVPEIPKETEPEMPPESPMRSPELENPDVLKYLQDTEDTAADPEKLWQELRKSYPKIQPFDYENGCEILTIRPQDIGRLPRESWVYGNNSFLLHGYYNFRYIILFRLGSKDGRPRYMIGVPGHYYSSEKYMASMFGFPNFVLSKKQPPNDGRFGYWYTDIRVR